MLKNNRLITSLLFLLTLVSVVVLWQNPWATFVVIALISVLLILNTGKKFVPIYIFCAVLGTFSEIIAAASGAWTYENQALFTVPVWLPLVWGNAGVLFAKLIIDFRLAPKAVKQAKKSNNRS